MKVAVVNNVAPFTRGGAEYLATTLVRRLEERGHEAELHRYPLRWDTPEAVFNSMLLPATTCVENTDLVIGLKFPAYYVQHRNKVVWLLHQFRQVYDLWDTPWRGLPDTEASTDLRVAIRAADQQALGACRARFTNSSVTADRMKRYNGLDATVLHPPLDDPEAFRTGPQGDYLFAPGRINGAKRQLLAVEAMAHAPAPLRLVVAGAPETAADETLLRERIAALRLEDRVELVPRFITDAEKVAWHAGSLGGVYLPYDEDSVGYVTMEAFAARKPVVTVADSGGILQLVEDGVTGAVAAPDAASLGAAFARLHRDRAAAARMGATAYGRLHDMGLTWDRVVARLTA